MDNGMTVGIEQEIIAELTIELQNEPTFSTEILAVKVRNAIREVKMKRNYVATSYTDAQIEQDLYNYYSTIKNLALYDYNTIGMEFQSGSSENSTSRTMIDRDDLFRGVHAFVKVL